MLTLCRKKSLYTRSGKHDRISAYGDNTRVGDRALLSLDTVLIGNLPTRPRPA